MKVLPDKIPFNLNRPKLQAYMEIIQKLIEWYTPKEGESIFPEERIQLILLQRMLIKLKQTELKLQSSFRANFPVEQVIALHTALKECGGHFDRTYLSHYYDLIMLQIDPILL